MHRDHPRAPPAARPRRTGWLALALAGFTGLGGLAALGPAQAAPIVAGATNLTLDGTAVQAGGVWQYRYTITETSNNAADLVRLIVSESKPHQGLHHENNFLNDGGGFQYDFAVPAQFAGLSAHNYFWNNLQVGAKQSITVGFDDVHGPTNATWGIQRGGAVNHIELTQLVPVPVPEPSQLAMLVAGMGLMGAVAVRRRRR